MELIVVRHALPIRVVNTEGTPADPPLDEPGHHQAEAVAAWLADPEEGRIDALWCSPMLRARQTAAPIAAALGLSPRFDADLAEYDRHHHEYIPVEQLKAEKGERWEALLRGESEGWVDAAVFRQQVVSVMERIAGAHRGQRVVAVCHGGVINAIASEVLGLAPGPGFFLPDYTCLNRIMIASTGERSIKTINETSHLRGTGLLSR